MEIRILLKNTVYLLITRVIKFFVGFIRTKLIAVILGTYGTGIISQINQLTELMARFTVSGMSDGLVKDIAESDKNEEIFRYKLAVAVKTYISIISIFLLTVLVLGLIFQEQLTRYFFGSNKYAAYYIIGLLTFPILVINGISFALLRSYKQIKYIARSELIGIIINIIIFIPLIYFWGLNGAALYIIIGYITVLLINHYYANSIILKPAGLKTKDIFRAKISKKLVKDLLVFAGYGLTAGVALILAEGVTRAIVVSRLGVNEIGIYSPVIILTSLFVGLIMPSISTYLYTRYCECRSNDELAEVMNDSIRFVTLLMIPFIFIITPIRYQIIPVVYSKEFIVAGHYLPWHLLGTLFYMWMYIFDQAMKPTGRIKIGGVIIIAMCTIDIAVVYAFIPRIALYAFMLKFIISPVLFYFFYLFYWKHTINYKMNVRNILLMVYIIFGFIVLMAIEYILTSNFRVPLSVGIILTGATILLLNKSERRAITRKLGNYLSENRENKRNEKVGNEIDSFVS